jgi:hypothetical protein
MAAETQADSQISVARRMVHSSLMVDLAPHPGACAAPVERVSTASLK